MNTNRQTIRQVTLVGAGVNIVLAAFKVTVGLVGGSQALIADGVHSLSDLVTDGAVLIGARYWSAEPDQEHPYGHGRIETLVCLGIGLALAAVALGIGWHAISTLHQPHTAAPGLVAMIAALASIASKEGLFRWTHAAGKRIGSRALIANAWHHRTDAFSSIPVACAVIGMFFFPDFRYLDHIAAVIVSIMLLKAAASIAWPCIVEILDSNTDRDINGLLEGLRLDFPEIQEIHKIRARRLGSSLVVDLHMLVDEDMTVGCSHQVAENFAEVVKEQKPMIQDIIIHVEPGRQESNL